VNKRETPLPYYKNNPEHGQLIHEDVVRPGGGGCEFRDGGRGELRARLNQIQD